MKWKGFNTRNWIEKEKDSKGWYMIGYSRKDRSIDKWKDMAWVAHRIDHCGKRNADLKELLQKEV